MGTHTCLRPDQPQENPDVPILFAFDGTPEVEAAFKDIFIEQGAKRESTRNLLHYNELRMHETER